MVYCIISGESIKKFGTIDFIGFIFSQYFFQHLLTIFNFSQYFSQEILSAGKEEGYPTLLISRLINFNKA